MAALAHHTATHRTNNPIEIFPTPFISFAPEFDRAILLPHLAMELAQDQKELLIRRDARTRWAILPGIVAAATHMQGPTEARHPMVRLLSLDERVPHVDSLAKYAAAFFKMSRSSVTRASSRFNPASSAAGSA